MSYQTGTATNPTDLLQQLATFLAANGWTQDSSVSDTGGWRLHTHRSSVYANLRATAGATNPWAFTPQTAASASSGALSLYLGTGYSGASLWNAQAGGPIGLAQTYNVGVACPLPTGAITSYHFFVSADQNDVCVVVERTTGNYGFVHWGVSLKKSGAYTGGAYFGGSMSGYASFSVSTTQPGAQLGITTYAPFHNGDGANLACGFVRADVDTFTGKYLTHGTVQTAAQQWTGKTSQGEWRSYRSGNTTVVDIPTLDGFVERAVPSLTQQPQLVPIRAWALRDALGYSLLGSVNNIFFCCATIAGFTPGTLLTLGPDNYLVFPDFAVKKV
jgi:hypothetical protein